MKFTPQQWVLVRDSDAGIWKLDISSHINNTSNYLSYVCVGGNWHQCIPFDGNESLLGTCNMPKEPKFEPKDGDIVTSDSFIAICKHPLVSDNGNYTFTAYAACWVGGSNDLVRDLHSYRQKFLRPSTEEEKNIILSKLHQIGKDWNPQTKKLIGVELHDGDFLTCYDHNHYSYILICKNPVKDPNKGWKFFSYIVLSNNPDLMDGRFYNQKHIRPSTEEEKKELISKMHKDGKDWNAETKELVDYKWKPKYGEEYWTIGIDENYNFKTFLFCWKKDSVDISKYKMGWVYKTKEEVIKIVEKLNEAIKNIK